MHTHTDSDAHDNGPHKYSGSSRMHTDPNPYVDNDNLCIDTQNSNEIHTRQQEQTIYSSDTAPA